MRAGLAKPRLLIIGSRDVAKAASYLMARSSIDSRDGYVSLLSMVRAASYFTILLCSGDELAS